MAERTWKWKNKNGAQSGLLYESGNWGDILKMLWLAEIIRWKQRDGAKAAYTDPFAGGVHYPLGKKYAFRLAQCRAGGRLPQLDFLQNTFIDKALWPSAASGVRLLGVDAAEVWDIDASRRDAWRAAGVSVLENAASGWDAVSRAEAAPGALLLIDPYDFLAEWREYLPLIAGKSGGISTLVYLYNRSGKSRERLADYRRFRGALDELTAGREKRLGRVAADAFLPDAHHEMIFLPCAADAARPEFGAISDALGECARELGRAQADAAVFEC